MEAIMVFVMLILSFIFGWGLKGIYDNYKKEKSEENKIIITKCHDCGGTGYEDFDQTGDPIDFCETCSGKGVLQIKQKDLRW